MGNQFLARVGTLHLALVAASALVLGASGRPIGGILMGGASMALAFGSLWGIVGALVQRQRTQLLVVFASLKIFLYAALAVLIFSGAIRADAPGFAAGVSCFLGATLLMTAARAAQRTV